MNESGKFWRGPTGKALKRLFRDRRAMISAGTILVVLLAALLANVLSPFSPEFQDSTILTAAPGIKHWFGTDSLGRDLFSRILSGSRISMAVAIATALSGIVLGCLYGGVSALAGGIVDTLMMRLLDLSYTLPTLLLLIFLNVLFGQGMAGILVALSLEGMMTVARLVRGQVLRLKEAEFVVAARALGASSFSILVKHMLPNMMGPVLVTLTFLIPSNIMYEAFLSFVGLGIQPPFSSWGTLANEGWRGLISHPHLILFPGIAIFVTMLAFNFLGDGLSEAFDPKGVS